MLKQLGHDGRHAVEVPGPAPGGVAVEHARSAPTTVHASCRSPAGRPPRAGARTGRRRPRPRASAASRGLVARVGVEVLGRAELGRVDEQRHHDDVAVLAGAAQQRQVALVEGAHRGDEPDAAARAALGRERLAQLGDGADGLMRALACCAPRARACARRARRRGRAARAPPRPRPARWRVTVASSPRAIGPVSAALGPVRRDVLDRLPHERQQQPPRLGGLEPGAGGDPLGGRLEGDQEVGGDRGGRVVGGAALVVDLERPSCRARARARRRRRAPPAWSRRSRSRRRRRRRTLAAGEGLERVQAERGAAGRRERGERGGAAGVADERGGAGHGRGGRRRSPRRGRTARSRRSRAAPRRGPSGPSTSTPAARSARHERRAQAAGSDDAHAGGAAIVCVRVHPSVGPLRTLGG